MVSAGRVALRIAEVTPLPADSTPPMMAIASLLFLENRAFARSLLSRSTQRCIAIRTLESSPLTAGNVSFGISCGSDKPQPNVKVVMPRKLQMYFRMIFLSRVIAIFCRADFIEWPARAACVPVPLLGVAALQNSLLRPGVAVARQVGLLSAMWRVRAARGSRQGSPSASRLPCAGRGTAGEGDCADLTHCAALTRPVGWLAVLGSAFARMLSHWRRSGS